MDLYLGVRLDNCLEGMGRNYRYLSCGIYHWQLPLHDGSGVQVTSRSEGDAQALRVIGGDCRGHLGVTELILVSKQCSQTSGAPVEPCGGTVKSPG